MPQVLTDAAIQAAHQVVADGFSGIDALPSRILHSNLVLEAFGNAATSVNNNSSRFGKFVRLLFDGDGQVFGARISTYVLEKSRLVLQVGPHHACMHACRVGRGIAWDARREDSDQHVSDCVVYCSSSHSQCQQERNFHVLHQLVAAGAADAATQGTSLPIRPPSEFWYLSQSGRWSIDGVDDSKAWFKTVDAFASLGLGDAPRLEMMQILCGILHLGSLTFEDGGLGASHPSDFLASSCDALSSSNESRALAEPNDANYDASRLCSDARSQEALALVGEMWGLDSAALAKWLTVRITTSRRLSSYEVGMTAAKATQNRDALAKEVYHKLFMFLVHTMNTQLVTSDAAVPAAELRWIGLLDAFGFEMLQRNSLEQLLINTTNELLQQFFLTCVMNSEAALYEAQNIPWTRIEYQDNAPTIALLVERPNGAALG